MSTTITPAPEPTIADLLKRIDELEAERNRPGALASVFASLAGWFRARHITLHVAAAAFASAGVLIAADPTAHQAFLDLWAHLPKWAVDLVAIGTPVFTLYIKGTKSTVTAAD